MATYGHRAIRRVALVTWRRHHHGLVNPRIHRALLAMGMLVIATVLAGAQSAQPAWADEEYTPAELVTELREHRLADGPSNYWSGADDVQPLLEDTDPAVYLVVSGVGELQSPRDHLNAVRRAMGVRGTYAGLYDERLYAVSDDIGQDALSDLLIETNDTGDEVDRVTRFVVRADELNGGSAVSGPESAEGDGGWGMGDWGFVEYALLVFALGLLAIFMVYRLGGTGRTAWGLLNPWYGAGAVPYPDVAHDPPPRRAYIIEPAQESWEESERLDDAWASAEEAITRLGEAAATTPTEDLGPSLRQHLQDCLDGYERAKRALAMDAARQTALATALRWIEDGEYHLAAIHAIRTGDAEPTAPTVHRLHRRRRPGSS